MNGASFQVVGVTADMQPPNSFHTPEMHLYLAYWQSKSTSEGDIRFAIRVKGDIDAALVTVRRLIRSIDAGVPIGEDMPMSEQARLEYSPVMLARSAMGFCGVLALCVSTIGLYSILAFIVRTRSREIGVYAWLSERAAKTCRSWLSRRV